MNEVQNSVIDRLARIETKLDSALRTQEKQQADIEKLKTGRQTDRAYFAGATAVIAFVFTFFSSYLKERFGL